MNISKSSDSSIPSSFVQLDGELLRAYAAYRAWRRRQRFLCPSSFLVCAGIYAYLAGPIIGFGVIVLLAFHEFGHVYAAHTVGIRGPLPIFIPFVGALIGLPPSFSKHEEAYIGFMGPFVGSVAAIVLLLATLLWFPTSSELLVVSGIGVTINMFNLLLPRPFDGGRVLVSFGLWSSIPLFALLLVISLSIPLPFTVLLVFICVRERFMERKFSHLLPKDDPVKCEFAWLNVYLALLGLLLMAQGALVMHALVLK